MEYADIAGAVIGALAIAWIADPANASGPNGVWARSWEHLWYTILAVVLASVIAIPLGYLVGHTGRGRGLGMR